MKQKSIIFFTLFAFALLGAFYQNLNQNQRQTLLQGNVQKMFTQWKKDFSMMFQQHQEFYRREIFSRNLKHILQHNSKSQKSYQLGLNQFSHLAQEEFAKLYLGIAKRINQQIKFESFSNELSQIVENIDWEALGKVSVVKNQGSCDAGYAFCTASLVQSFYMFQNKNVLLSEQQIIDCSANYTTFGCNSGSRIGTINFAKQKGLTAQSGYPYKGVKGNCTKQTGQYLANFTLIQSNGCSQLASNLITSPMTVAVNAQTWQSYRSGIYDGCTSIQVNHDTYLVGVTNDYWRIKNSWGNKWGEYGYIRLKLGNTCGICEKTGFGFK